MCRIAVIGNAGGGKSELCKKLEKSKNLPRYQVDKFQWAPGWKARPNEEVKENIRKVISEDFWILDGWGPWETIEERFQKADTIIIVDHSVWIHFWWAAKRQIKSIFIPSKIEKPEGCNLLHVSLKLIQMIWNIDRNIMPKLLSAVQGNKFENDVYHIRSPRELNLFISQHC